MGGVSLGFDWFWQRRSCGIESRQFRRHPNVAVDKHDIVNRPAAPGFGLFVHCEGHQLARLAAFLNDPRTDQSRPAFTSRLNIGSTQNTAPLLVSGNRDFHHAGDIALVSFGKRRRRSKRKGKNEHKQGLAAGG